MGDLGDLISSSSPLTGGYLLVVLAEPHSEQHKEALLKRLAKGKLKQQTLRLESFVVAKDGSSE